MKKVSPQEALGKEVRRRRLMAGMTLEQLAIRSGLTPNYLGSVELGKRDVSLSTIDSIAEGLGVAPGELLGASGEMNPAAEEGGRLLARLPVEMQVSFIKVLREVVKSLRR